MTEIAPSEYAESTMMKLCAPDLFARSRLVFVASDERYISTALFFDLSSASTKPLTGVVDD